MELTILMPCLNEEETIAVCIRKARQFLEENHVDGEVLISDNGSTDASREIAALEGARVVLTEEQGYGSALIHGTREARGRYVIMGDADDSYDFLHLMPFLEKLREGYELVMGNRFTGGIEKGAMPFSHQYIGNPVLSFLGRLFLKSNVGDFHCGLRGYDREAIINLGLQTTGMEYASEMVVLAELNHLKITEVPTTLKKDGRSGKPHLRSFRDGWRHLKFLLMYAPDWLFLYPGIAFLLVGVILGASLIIDDLRIDRVRLSIHTLLYCMCAIVMGWHIIGMYLTVKVYAYNKHFAVRDEKDWNKLVPENLVIGGGAFVAALGVILSIIAFINWQRIGFGDLIPEQTMRLAIPAILLLLVGSDSISTGFIIGILKIKSNPIYLEKQAYEQKN